MRDICTYTYYPIRFNRRTREIYVFRHNGDGGVLSIPWDRAFFFIGRGRGGEKHLLELRCHALNKHDRVIATFGIGHDDTTPGGISGGVGVHSPVHGREGPQSLPQHPVSLSPEGGAEGKLDVDGYNARRCEYGHDDLVRAIVGCWHGNALPDSKDLQGTHLAPRGRRRLSI